MFISKAQISSFMAFRETDTIEFQPGFNIIVGKNNVGKTALLKALALQFDVIPHRSPITVPAPEQNPPPSTSVLTFTFDKVELREVLEKQLIIKLPFPRPSDNLQPADIMKRLLKWLKIEGQFEIPYMFWNRNPDPIIEAFGLYRPHKKDSGWSYIEFNGLTPDAYKDGITTAADKSDSLEWYLFSKAKESIYQFDAERPNLGQCPFGSSNVLKPDASNLPEVLDVLSGNPVHYQEFNEYVSRVLPSVKWVSPKNLGNAELSINIWMIDPKTRREDLAIPLASCGTGVGQVLAMLYVVFTADKPKTIIIDEPQSFLHPSAIRELIEVFKAFPQHQYIIATHSPLIVSAAHPCKITQISHDGNEAIIVQQNSEEVDAIRNFLDEIGLKLSDVFGADNILWVEGPTEEKCFRLILENIANYPIRGTLILGVKNVGDFYQKKKARVRLVFDIYNRLSTGQALFPPAVGFLFDREALKEGDIEDLKRESPRPVEFLPRRLYENYLLFPDAIAAILSQDSDDESITFEQVSAWIEEKKSTGEFLPSGSTQNSSNEQEWLTNVDGARLLTELFRDFSDCRVEYQKTRHSYLLTKWLMENHKEELKELESFLVDFLLNECSQM